MRNNGAGNFFQEWELPAWLARIGVVTGWAQMPEGYQTGAFEWALA